MQERVRAGESDNRGNQAANADRRRKAVESLGAQSSGAQGSGPGAVRRLTEKRLWRDGRLARHVVENCIDCVAVLDAENRVEYISPSGQAAMEIDDARMGQSWLGLWRDEDRPRIEEAIRRSRRGEASQFQAGRTAASGNHTLWDVRMTRVLGREGASNRLIAIARDITELRRAQQIAMQAEKVAAAGRMAATIAHEINNPLEAVTNFLFLVRTTPGLPEAAVNQLEIADRELTRVAQIAQKTLGFYRDASKNKWVDARATIDDILLLYERRLRSKRIETIVQADSSLRVFVKEGELKQILSNLLANAIDASREGGRIWVRAQASRDWGGTSRAGVRITVADNGSGIPPQIQKRIFVPFFSTKANVGTGIGLWVTKSLIEQQDGSMYFRSREDKGTVMSLFLPNCANRCIHAIAA